jgi:hypothetical protein
MTSNILLEVLIILTITLSKSKSTLHPFELYLVYYLTLLVEMIMLTIKHQNPNYLMAYRVYFPYNSLSFWCLMTTRPKQTNNRYNSKIHTTCMLGCNA